MVPITRKYQGQYKGNPLAILLNFELLTANRLVVYSIMSIVGLSGISIIHEHIKTPSLSKQSTGLEPRGIIV